MKPTVLVALPVVTILAIVGLERMIIRLRTRRLSRLPERDGAKSGLCGPSD